MPRSVVYKSVGRGRIAVWMSPQEAIAKPSPRESPRPVPEKVSATREQAKKWKGTAGSLAKRTAMPSKSKVPRWKRILKMAGINASAIGIQTVVQAVFGENIYLSHITFTVGGEMNVTFYDGAFPMTGPMDFGGADEPRGAVMDHGRSPILCSMGEPFRIGIDANEQISGYVTYYTLPGAED